MKVSKEVMNQGKTYKITNVDFERYLEYMSEAKRLIDLYGISTWNDFLYVRSLPIPHAAAEAMMCEADCFMDIGCISSKTFVYASLDDINEVIDKLDKWFYQQDCNILGGD